MAARKSDATAGSSRLGPCRSWRRPAAAARRPGTGFRKCPHLQNLPPNLTLAGPGRPKCLGECGVARVPVSWRSAGGLGSVSHAGRSGLAGAMWAMRWSVPEGAWLRLLQPPWVVPQRLRCKEYACATASCLLWAAPAATLRNGHEPEGRRRAPVWAKKCRFVQDLACPNSWPGRRGAAMRPASAPYSLQPTHPLTHNTNPV